MAGSQSADLSRRHLISRDRAGVLTITGGKLTTYRAMAEETVDLVMTILGAEGRCRTRQLPLIGAATPERLADVDADPWFRSPSSPRRAEHFLSLSASHPAATAIIQMSQLCR